MVQVILIMTMKKETVRKKNTTSKLLIKVAAKSVTAQYAVFEEIVFLKHEKTHTKVYTIRLRSSKADKLYICVSVFSSLDVIENGKMTELRLRLGC